VTTDDAEGESFEIMPLEDFKPVPYPGVPVEDHELQVNYPAASSVLDWLESLVGRFIERTNDGVRYAIRTDSTVTVHDREIDPKDLLEGVEALRMMLDTEEE
jgi:hypothetical protein